jgi:hypothetical protein
VVESLVGPAPAELMADTENQYWTPLVRPLRVEEVELEPIWAATDANEP